ATHECSVICGPIGCAVDFVCRLLHLKIISLKKPLQIGLCNKAVINYQIQRYKYQIELIEFALKQKN
ncbi:hypothetical protein PB731_18515, partial [Acinetobacter baumannii]|nr:hypothetical protein [Acinetobacter baumannii]